jgi:NAD(P)H-dependent flavin oxidoreductase YrpB (nitropropane dioxygenase family)
MPPRWNENRLTAKLGIDYPVIQGPLGGLSSQKLTAAVSHFGGLGSFGAHSLTPEAIKEAIAEIRALTSKPFAMNLWVSMEDEGARTSDENAFNRSLAPLTTHLAALGAPHPKFKPYSPARFEDQARVLLDAKVPVFSFIFGIPPREILEECRAKSIVTIARGFTGRLARGIHNRLLQELNQEGTAVLPYPLQRSLVRNVAIPAEAAGRSDLLPLWAGQSANLSTCTDVSGFLTSLVEEISEIAGPIIQWSAARREKQILK